MLSTRDNKLDLIITTERNRDGDIIGRFSVYHNSLDVPKVKQILTHREAVTTIGSQGHLLLFSQTCRSIERCFQHIHHHYQALGQLIQPIDS
jgi:hypothetical protein